MSREIMIIAKNKDGVVSNNIVKIGENGEHIVIKGTKDTFYEIKDMATNRAPDQIYTKRFKNDLKLKINPKGGALDGMGEADVTIENYCANGNCEIVGVHETGEYYQYVPQSGDKGLMTTKMADGEFAYQSLGTVEAGGFGPLSALPLAGLAGLGGGGGGKKPDTTAPDAPNLTMVNDDVDGEKGYTEWGRDIDAGSWNFDSITGEWSVSSGNVNVTNDGKIITNDNTPTFSGTGGEAGATVAVYNGTMLLGSAVVGSNGDWSVLIDDVNKLIDGEYSLFLTQTDTSGNVDGGTTVNMIIDTGRPSQNESVTLSDGENTRESDSPGGTTASLDYEGMNRYFSNELTISDDVLNSSVYGDFDYSAGDSIYIKLTVTKEDGTQITYLIGGPDGPTITIENDGDSWSVTINNTNAYNTTTGKYETLADGEYTAEIVISDLASNTRAVTIGDFAIDTIAPTPNNVEYVGTANNTSSVTMTSSVTIGGEIADYKQFAFGDFLDNNNNGIAERNIDYITGTTAAQIFVSRDGVSLDDPSSNSDNIYVGTNAENTWSFTETLGDGVYKYEIETMDVAGNSSDSTEAFWVVVDNGGTHSYDLTEVDGATGKDFENMVLIGNNSDETFTLDNVGFGSIDAKTGTDTFVLTGSGQILDIAKTKNFEVYNINGNKLTINGDVNADSDHIVINGTSSATVDLSTDWSMSASQTQSGYTIYTNTGSDDLWIQNTATVHIV